MARLEDIMNWFFCVTSTGSRLLIERTVFLSGTGKPEAEQANSTRWYRYGISIISIALLHHFI
jgi:hypothetical protein